MIIELFVIESTFVHKSDMLLNVLDLERKKKRKDAKQIRAEMLFIH